MIRCMVEPSSLKHWKLFIKKLQKEVPQFINEAKVTLNSLVGLAPDSLEWTEELIDGYSDKELKILSKYGRLTEK